jgi:alginate O-acetyltransferase complex protein AlgI
MLFNSIDFAVFLPIVFFLYWFILNRDLRVQNLFLIVVSYVFYGWWDPRFLILIAISSLVDYLVGLGLGKTDNSRQRKILLLTSIFINLGILVFFKYFNFFSENFSKAFTFIGQPITDRALLSIILPVGISFYTFQTLSYTIDVYKKKIEPTKDIIAFFAFVSFFPQLVSGPIERAINFLPQFFKKREFDYEKAVDGMRQILWGFVKKIVIADTCAIYANDIFMNYKNYSGSTLFLGVFFFTFQVYGDFSGYSDIAIGTGRLFGFDLMRNFAYPFFSRNIAEFWRRWHISLSTWFRDYVYIPLGGSRGGTFLKIRNIFIVFILTGFWHGANWTFIVWGILNALYFLPIILLRKTRVPENDVAENSYLPGVKETLQILSTLLLFGFSLIFFRSPTLDDTFSYISGICSNTILRYPEVIGTQAIVLVILLTVMEWIQRKKQHGLQFNNESCPVYVRWLIYYVLLLLLWQYAGKPQEFVYFQF